MAIALLTFGAAFGLSAIVLTWIAIHGYRMYREVRVVTCPETRAPVAVRLHAARAAVTNLTGIADFRLSSCSRWPERRNCGQECVSQIKAAPRECSVRSILAKSYRGAHKPVLMSPDRRTRIEWDEIPPERLPAILSTHSKICWNCHMEESFRTLHPDLAARAPSRGGARRSVAS